MRYSNPIPASPEEIQQMTIDIILAKDRRVRRAQRNYVLMPSRIASEGEPKEMSVEAQELALTGALNILFYKVRNNKLIRRKYSLLLRENERKFQPQVKEFMDYMTKKLKAGLPKMRGKTATQKAKSIADWGEIRKGDRKS